ncbi:hypothetical protein K438DRAFT_1957251 [Mycena galopus ATCC 62051]|nr:hypothetical protein K438DRAFT_1957251 [Mycena galopus ATCC 62051]
MQLATDITYQQSTIELRMTRITGLLAVQVDMRKDREDEVKMREAEITTAQNSINVLSKAKRDAEGQRDETKHLIIVRNILTLGLGEAGDWGNLNAALRAANKIISDAEAQVVISRQAKADAEAAARVLTTEIQRLTNMKAEFERLGPVLRNQARVTSELTASNNTFRNNASQLSTVMGELVAQSSILPAQHTARELAAKILEIRSVIKTQSMLTGLFVTNPEILDNSLKAIAASPEAPSAETDDI